MLLLPGRGDHDHRYRETKLHNVIDQDFNVVNAGRGKLNLRKHRYVDGVMSGVL